MFTSLHFIYAHRDRTVLLSLLLDDFLVKRKRLERDNGKPLPCLRVKGWTLDVREWVSWNFGQTTLPSETVLPYAEWNKDSYIMEWQNY